MDEARIYSELEPIFQDLFDDESICVHPQLSPDDLASWDSLMHLRLLLTIEKKFDFRFSTVEIGSLRNAGELVRVIQARSRAASLSSASQSANRHEDALLGSGTQP